MIILRYEKLNEVANYDWKRLCHKFLDEVVLQIQENPNRGVMAQDMWTMLNRHFTRYAICN